MVTYADLREHVTLQTVTAASGETETTSTLDQVWAAIRPMRASEAVQAGQVVGTVGYVVTIRYRDDVGLSNRILWGTRTLMIHGCFDQAGDRRWLTLMCSERAS